MQHEDLRLATASMRAATDPTEYPRQVFTASGITGVHEHSSGSRGPDKACSATTDEGGVGIGWRAGRLT
jgi:hypothetical protein